MQFERMTYSIHAHISVCDLKIKTILKDVLPKTWFERETDRDWAHASALSGSDGRLERWRDLNARLPTGDTAAKLHCLRRVRFYFSYLHEFSGKHRAVTDSWQASFRFKRPLFQLSGNPTPAAQK